MVIKATHLTTQTGPGMLDTLLNAISFNSNQYKINIFKKSVKITNHYIHLILIPSCHKHFDRSV